MLEGSPPHPSHQAAGRNRAASSSSNSWTPRRFRLGLPFSIRGATAAALFARSTTTPQESELVSASIAENKTALTDAESRGGYLQSTSFKTSRMMLRVSMAAKK